MNTKILLIALMILSATLTVACNGSAAASVADVKLSKRLNEDREPADPSNAFLTTDRVIHCVIYFTDAKEGARVRANWIGVRVEGRRDNEEVGQSSAELKSGAVAVALSFSPANARIAPGAYRVDIYIDGESKAAHPAKTVEFTLAAGAPEIIKAVLARDADGRGAVSADLRAGIKRLFCHLTLRGATAGTIVSARWIVEDVAGAGKGATIDQTSTTVSEGQSSVDLIYEDETGLSRGVYRVDLFIGDSTRPARSISFTVGE